MQHRWLCRRDSALLQEFALECLEQSLAGLDPATRQVPARDVTVLDEEQTALRVDYDRLHTQRHAAGKARIEMQTTLDCGGV